MIHFFTLFCVLPAENETAEQQNIHTQEEKNQDNHGQRGLFGSQCCQQHHGETEDNGREVLVHHVICSGAFKLSVNAVEALLLAGSAALGVYVGLKMAAMLGGVLL